MANSRHHGRTVLLEALRKMDKQGKDSITRHLFVQNDYFITSQVGLLDDFKRQDQLTSESVLNKACARLVTPATKLLKDLALDMKLALQITKWDRDILQDVLRLISFLRDGAGAWERLKNACNTHNKKPVGVRQSYAKDYDQLIKDLDDTLRANDVILSKLVQHLKSNSCNAREYIDPFMLELDKGGIETCKIPTLTLRELFVLNEAYQRESQLWDAADCMLENSETQSPALTGIVEQIFRVCSPQYPGEKEVGRRCSWFSNCLVLVLDTENRVILTGGTQLTCHDQEPFKTASKTIKSLRVGGEFAEVIKNCSEEFATRCKSVKLSDGDSVEEGKIEKLTASEVEKQRIYEQVVSPSISSKWYEKIPVSTKDKPLLSWACDGTSEQNPLNLSFEFKRPCLRCISFYSSWILHQTPKEKEEKKCVLQTDLFSHLSSSNPQGGWSYCAETAAALKVYLLRAGTLALV